jgi:hypothetical protein
VDHGDNGAAIQVAVTGNTVQQVTNGFGIYVHGAGSGTVDARVANNFLLAPAGSLAGGQGEAIHVNFASTASSSVSACTDIRGNNISSSGGATTWGSGGSGSDIYLRHRRQAGSNIALPGYAGGPTDVAAVMAFVSGNNGGASTYADTTGASPSGYLASPGCTTP